MNKELKLCPFCGCHDRRVSVRKMGSEGYRIICGKCGCAGPYVKIKEFPNKMDAQGKAKETWNRRVNELMNSTIRRMIREQPVAYDVDKVVRQLEAYSNADEAERLGTMPVVELADAIKIVKGGGADGD